MPITTYNIANKPQHGNITSHTSVDTQSKLERAERLAKYSGLNSIDQDTIQEIKRPVNTAPKKYILGYKESDSIELTLYSTEQEADYNSEEWVSVYANSLEDAKSKYEQAFQFWKEDNI